MDPAAFVWFMVVSFWSGAVVMPVPYQTEEMCKWAAQQAAVDVACIPQPAGDLAMFTYLSSADGFEGPSDGQ